MIAVDPIDSVRVWNGFTRILTSFSFSHGNDGIDGFHGFSTSSTTEMQYDYNIIINIISYYINIIFILYYNIVYYYNILIIIS